MERARWEARLSRWRERLVAWGLEGVAAALLEAAEPLSVLGAQVLYVAQPTLGIFLPAREIGRWARLLEDPANVAWVRERLAGPDDGSGSDDAASDGSGRVTDDSTGGSGGSGQEEAQ